MEEEENNERIISKVKESFNSPQFSDIFHCHKIILSSREGSWGIEQSLASTNILHWPDIKDNIVERILHWIYLGKRLASELDSREFLQDPMGAAVTVTLKLTDVKTSVEDLISDKDDVKLQVLRESKKQGMIKACNTCPGCLREDCKICRECQDMKKHGGEGKLKKRCRLRQCSAQIQTRNLRKLNGVNREALTKVPPKFLVVEKKNLFITKIVKIPCKSISNGLLDIGQQMSSSEKNICPDEVSHEVSTTDESLCSNAETSVREDKVCVTGEEDQDNVPVSVSNAGHDYTLISWVSKILDFSD